MRSNPAYAIMNALFDYDVSAPGVLYGRDHEDIVAYARRVFGRGDQDDDRKMQLSSEFRLCDGAALTTDRLMMKVPSDNPDNQRAATFLFTREHGFSRDLDDNLVYRDSVEAPGVPAGHITYDHLVMLAKLATAILRGADAPDMRVFDSPIMSHT